MKPNIIVFFSDDHAAWALPSAGNREINAPHISSLAASGTIMENAFTPCPVCSPARASFWTGLYPSQHGVHDHLAEDDPVVAATPWLQDIPTLADYLGGSGYSTAMCGKWHCGAGEKPKSGFDYWYSSWRKTPKYSAMTHKYSDQGQVVQRTGYDTRIITDAAIDFLRQRASQHIRQKPFFLFIGYATTHNPWINRDEELVSHYRNATFSDIPDDSCYAFGEPGTHPVAPDDPREALAQYYASVTMIDAAVGRVLGELDRQDERDETLIVYTSDHGLNMGHHGIWGKGNGSVPLNMLEESIRVPLILNYSGQSGQVAGDQRRGELVNHCDLFMTLLDFADARPKARDGFPGRSFRHLLASADDPAWHNRTVVEYGPVRALRDARYKLVQRQDGDQNLLHDLRRDPRETVNLYRDARCHELVKTMTEALDEFFAEYEVAERSGLRADELPIHNRHEAWRGKNVAPRRVL